MNVLLAVLLCLSAVLADEYYPGGHHGTTVCIEIRPSPHANPTKVCGPVVHGGPQAPTRTQQKAADPSMVFNLPPAHHSSESDESKEAQAPCGTNGQKSIMPFPMRQASQPQPQLQQQQPMAQPQHMMQRMEMSPEGMLPMMAMDFEGANSGWRQANQPCPHSQRAAAMPMGFPGPMMPPPMNRPPMPAMPSSRTWMVNPQQNMMMRGAEEMGMAMGMRANEEKPPSQPMKKESLENLLKECEEKTKMLQEKEAKISELKANMANKKEEDTMMKKD